MGLFFLGLAGLVVGLLIVAKAHELYKRRRRSSELVADWYVKDEHRSPEKPSKPGDSSYLGG